MDARTGRSRHQFVLFSEGNNNGLGEHDLGTSSRTIPSSFRFGQNRRESRFNDGADTISKMSDPTFAFLGHNITTCNNSDRGSNNSMPWEYTKEMYDAKKISIATAQAIATAKLILSSGGTELSAHKTALAAAQTTLIPPNSSVGFLRKRKLRRQAGVVASMAVVAARNESSSWSNGSCSGENTHLNNAVTCDAIAPPQQKQPPSPPPQQQQQNGQPNNSILDGKEKIWSVDTNTCGLNTFSGCTEDMDDMEEFDAFQPSPVSRNDDNIFFGNKGYKAMPVKKNVPSKHTFAKDNDCSMLNLVNCQWWDHTPL